MAIFNSYVAVYQRVTVQFLVPKQRFKSMKIYVHLEILNESNDGRMSMFFLGVSM